MLICLGKVHGKQHFHVDPSRMHRNRYPSTGYKQDKIFHRIASKIEHDTSYFYLIKNIRERTHVMGRVTRTLTSTALQLADSDIVRAESCKNRS